MICLHYKRFTESKKTPRNVQLSAAHASHLQRGFEFFHSLGNLGSLHSLGSYLLALSESGKGHAKSTTAVPLVDIQWSPDSIWQRSSNALGLLDTLQAVFQVDLRLHHSLCEQLYHLA